MRLICLLLVLFVSSGNGYAEYYKAVFMDIDQAQKKWGISKFSFEKFKNASAEKRAPMAVDLVKNKKLIGKDILFLRKQLGEPDGYLFSDAVIGYLIQPVDKENKDSWQMVLIPNKEHTKLSEIKINKKCCFKKPDWVD